MPYKIAVASSDGVNIDLSFRDSERFLIYEVNKTGEYNLSETRLFKDKEQAYDAQTFKVHDCGCKLAGTGCNGGNIRKVSLLEDCRSVICSEVGMRVRKQFASKAISIFDVNCSIEKALDKIINYYKKIDNHESLVKSPIDRKGGH